MKDLGVLSGPIMPWYIVYMRIKLAKSIDHPDIGGAPEAKSNHRRGGRDSNVERLWAVLVEIEGQTRFRCQRSRTWNACSNLFTRTEQRLSGRQSV